ncbi:phosphatase PAP2 family protein [Bosea sp. AS-1]|uniref:phosphatase PAP2 family protein n=1 Tax=Bosea sp. AS-1 TaxID=2015316 RepID=UPI0020BFEF8D|nr:phosphatase PAP2 family protein [Bosea sp. AS-1]
MHAAGKGPAETPASLKMSSPANLMGFEGWVRASLYLSEFLRQLDWRTDTRSGAEAVSFSWRKPTFLSLHRPPMALFLEQVALMRDYMDLRGERSAEILTQLGYPIDYFAMILGLNSARNRFTFELIAATQVLTSHVAMIAKHHLACRRPDRLGTTVMPMISTPGHATFPSAHAAEAFAVATVIEGLLKAVKPLHHYPSTEKLVRLVFKQAERVAVNRTVAGVHFPIDSWAGAALGEAVGQIVLALCGAKSVKVTPRSYAARNIDFAVSAFRPDLWPGIPAEHADPNVTGFCREVDGHAVPVRRSSLFDWLWEKSLDEFRLS